MFRKSFMAFAVSLTEAQKLFFDAETPRSVAVPGTLPSVLESLVEHFHSQDELFAKVALDHVVQLDNTDTDSALVSQCMVKQPTRPAAHMAPTDASASPASTSSSSSSGSESVNVMLQLMRRFPNSVEVRERCCRCMANMCHVDRTASPSAVSLAERLVRDGAVEQALGTLSLGTRLSPRGRCWAAMATLNLIALSKSGPARATAANAEDVLANFILSLIEDSMESGSSVDGTSTPDEEGSLRGMPALTATALDASLGALTAVLSAEAPENASGISFNYERASYGAVEAVTRALLFTSGLLVRDGRNDGAYSASLPSRRYGAVHLVRTASPTQQAAIMTLLPLLHKGWIALQQVSSHAPNLPLIFDALYDAANTNQESAVMDDGTATLEMTETANKQYVAALSNLVEAAMFLAVEVEGLEDVAEELAQLQQDSRQNIMATLEQLTASRKDADQRQRAAETAAASSSTADPAASAFELYPTPAAMGVTDVLASGTVADLALATAVRLHADHNADGANSGQQGLPVPYTTEAFTLLSKSLLVLGNLGAIGDSVATSANTIAALQALLTDATEVLQTMPSVYKKELAQLFKPTEYAEKEGSEAAAAAGTISDAHRLLFLQHAAVVGQTYAVLWSALRTAAGVETVREVRLTDTAQSVQTLLTTTYQAAIDEAHSRYGQSKETGGAAKGWVSNTAEESVARLVRLGGEVISNMASITDTPASSQPTTH